MKTEGEQERRGDLTAAHLLQLRLWAKEGITKSHENRKKQFGYPTWKWQSQRV